jgi:hypothetical protein
MKIKPKHSWVALTTHSLTDEQARASLEGIEIPLTKAMIVDVTGPICSQCGALFNDATDYCSTATVESEEMGTSRPDACLPRTFGYFMLPPRVRQSSSCRRTGNISERRSTAASSATTRAPRSAITYGRSGPSLRTSTSSST